MLGFIFIGCSKIIWVSLATRAALLRQLIAIHFGFGYSTAIEVTTFSLNLKLRFSSVLPIWLGQGHPSITSELTI